MLRPLVLAGLALVLLAAPPAQAQWSASVALAISPPDDAIPRDESLSTQGTMTYTSDMSAVADTSGIEVRYVVSESPEWLSVVVSPASDVFVMSPQPAVTYSYMRVFTVTFTADPNYAAEAIGAVKIQAVAISDVPGSRVAVGQATVPVRLLATEPGPCDDPATHAALAPEAAAQQPSPIKVQSAAPPTAAPVPVAAAAVGGFAVAGAGAGLLLRRRL